jgi:hypothetical protein
LCLLIHQEEERINFAFGGSHHRYFYCPRLVRLPRLGQTSWPAPVNQDFYFGPCRGVGDSTPRDAGSSLVTTRAMRLWRQKIPFSWRTRMPLWRAIVLRHGRCGGRRTVWRYKFCRPRPHRGCWSSWPDLGERCSSGLGATAAEDRLSIRRLTRTSCVCGKRLPHALAQRRL